MWVINVLRCLFWMLAWLFGLFVSSLGWVLGFGCFGCLGLPVLVDLGSGDSDLVGGFARFIVYGGQRFSCVFIALWVGCVYSAWPWFGSLIVLFWI